MYICVCVCVCVIDAPNSKEIQESFSQRDSSHYFLRWRLSLGTLCFCFSLSLQAYKVTHTNWTPTHAYTNTHTHTHQVSVSLGNMAQPMDDVIRKRLADDCFHMRSLLCLPAATKTTSKSSSLQQFVSTYDPSSVALSLCLSPSLCS